MQGDPKLDEFVVAGILTLLNERCKPIPDMAERAKTCHRILAGAAASLAVTACATNEEMVDFTHVFIGVLCQAYNLGFNEMARKTGMPAKDHFQMKDISDEEFDELKAAWSDTGPKPTLH